MRYGIFYKLGIFYVHLDAKLMLRRLQLGVDLTLILNRLLPLGKNTENLRNILRCFEEHMANSRFSDQCAKKVSQVCLIFYLL